MIPSEKDRPSFHIWLAKLVNKGRISSFSLSMYTILLKITEALEMLHAEEALKLDD